ncbi:uroporphyrinogen-III synthase [Arthrobacter sp. SW1]|uniref:uroporphyrinogen-III synthase n=1 Tax=Arthrobacter sp. SW1 TaxID=1920889 RepID=UPI000877CB26|nr:uroporphyrinogen-III synthase [Arthrobacter sp. SW1]OFI39891.1 uroporphyrinogen-III synthase [Arthrobacter sp. SW1]
MENAAAAPLRGRKVLITRSPDRAASLAQALSDAGAEPLLLPLIDFERAADQQALGDALDGLAAGDYDWLVVSSITTVRALKAKAAERGAELSALIPAGVRVATIGPSSRRILEAEGIRVDLAPEGSQSAAGLLEVWPEGTGRVLLPQADIADTLLSGGLAAKGAEVAVVTAYRTVDYPARPDERLVTELAKAPAWSDADGGELPLLEPAAARTLIDDGGLAAVVAASPSAARRVAATLLPLRECRFIAIGRSTAAEAADVGIAVAATAKEPTPDGIVAALTELFATEGLT